MAASTRTNAIQKEVGFAKPFGMAVACQEKVSWHTFSWLYFLTTVLNLKSKENTKS